MLKMSTPRSGTMVFSFMIVLLLLLSACGTAGPGTSHSSTVVKGGTWIDDLYADPSSLLPDTSAGFQYIIDQTLYAPLFYGDSQGSIHPGLVAEMPTVANGEISADSKTWTFKLRPGLVWSDGQPLTAEDIDFSWRLWINPKFPTYGTLGYNLITSTDISPDKLLITFHLSTPFAPFISAWTDGIVAPLPKHFFAKVAPDKILNTPDNLNPSVTSGPFIQLVSPPISAEFEAMYFDFHNLILGKELNVRKAIAMAIDYQALITTARRGLAVPLCTDHSTAYHPGYQPDAPCPKFDPAAANALLEQEGWTKGPDGVRTKAGQRLELQYSTTSGNSWHTATEEIIQANLQAIGIKIDIHNYPDSAFYGSILPDAKPGQYDIAEYENYYNYDADDATLLACNQFPPAGGNDNFYCNPALDKLYFQEEATTDPATRQHIFNQIHQIYLTEFPLITLYGTFQISVAKKTTHSYMPGPFGAQETVNVWEWWCDGGHC